MSTLYCDLIDVQRLLSLEGVSYRVDDDPAFCEEHIEEASLDLELYLLADYAEASLTASRWARYQCAVITATYLCERRGNGVPRGIERKFERTMQRLEMIHAGRLNAPDMVRRRTNVPTLSQPRIRLDPFPRTVIERRRGISRNQPQDYPQRRDALEWFDYGSGI